MRLPRPVKRVLWFAAIALALVFAAIQLVPVERTNPEVVWELDAPLEVRAILKRACYDCHSHETRWPWYSRVAPVSWWVTDHVEEGRRDLNFSDWPAFDAEEQAYVLGDIVEQLERGEMPLESYTLLHPEARLDETDRATLIEWARSGGFSIDRP